MVNSIKESGGGGLALQITKPARSASLVEENQDGEATYLAEVRVFAFDHLLLVVDLDRMTPGSIAELVVAAAGDTGTIYRAMDSGIQIAGNGYQVQLPPAADAGFSRGDSAPVTTAKNMLVIRLNDGTSAASSADRIARDLKTIREEQ